MPTGGGFNCPSTGVPVVDSELRILCDLAPDGTAVPFLRRYTIDAGTVNVTDTTLDGTTPYAPTGEVTVCGDLTAESPGEPCDTTTPVATTGLCLADSTPIAVTVERDCQGTVVQVGWLDLTTGTFTDGTPPAGTRACGETSAFDVSGVFCDIDPATGDVLGLVLVEIERGPDGSIVGVRLVDPATGGTYTLQGELSHCPAGVQQPDQDLTLLCEVQPDGTVTAFVRDYRRDENGVIVGFADYTLAGAPHTPTGAVAVCQPEDESPPEPCTRCQTQLLCDDGDVATIQGTTAGGTLPNGVTWSSRGAGGPQAASTDNADGAWWPGVYRFPNPTIGDATWEFDRPAVVEFSIYMRWIDFSDPADLNATQLPPGVEVVSLPDGYHYDPATRQVSVDDSRGDPGGEGCANLLDPSRAESARFRTTTAVTSVVTRYLGARASACGQFGLQRVGALNVTPASEFLRTICRDCGGVVTSVSDTELDGLTAYTVAGEVGPCYPPPKTPQAPCVGGVQTLRLCDLDPAAAPDMQGRICATPFLRHLVYACDGTLAEVRDTTLDGTTEYSPVQVVDCHTTIPGLVELNWPLTSIADDPGGTAGQDYIYTLTNPVTGETAEVRLHASSVAGSGCAWTGPPSPANPPIFNNPTTYTYTLSEQARAMSRFRLDFLDLDGFEGIRNLSPIPDDVVFVQGAGVWNGSSIDATVNDSVVQVFWNTPPETISHSYANTGGGLACHSAVLAALTAAPDGCCTCGPDESPGSPAEPPCRNTSTLLVCDLPTDGVEGEPAATDTDPTPYPWDSASVRCVNPVPGGAASLWSGGSVVFPATTTGCGGQNSQVLLGAAATLQAPRPGCDDGTVQVDVSVRLTNDGPATAVTNYAGTLRIHRTDTGERLATTPRPSLGGTVPGESRTLAVTATVPANLLAAGQLVAVFDVESFDDSQDVPGGTQWTADQFTATFAYGIDGCETQVLANVVTDCETGDVVSVTYTDMHGNPYTPQGEIGQCVPTAPSAEPCNDCETITLCDLVDPSLGSPGESPGEPEPVPFLRTICRDCQGQILSVQDTTLDGDPYEVTGQVGLCGPTDTGEEQCRNTNSTLLCDVTDEGQVAGSLTATAVPPGETDPFNGWSGYNVPATWCQDGANPGTLYQGGSTTYTFGDPCALSGGRQRVTAAVLDDPGLDCEQVTVTASARVENLGPNPGFGGDGVVALWNTRTGSLLTRQLVQHGAPVGWVETLNLQATVSNADLAVGNIVFSVDLETRHQGAKEWLVDQFTAAYEATCLTTNEFLRHQVVDCDGNVISQVDTTLDGQPYTVTGEVGQCQQAPPADECGDTEIITLCDLGDPSPGSPGESPGEQAATAFLRRITFDCNGQVVTTQDLTLDGIPYDVQGEVGVCGPADTAEPCRNSSTLLVCDIPTDGVEGEPTATDTDPTPYPWQPGALAKCADPLPGGGAALWSGGTLNFPQDTSTAGSCHPAQVLRGVAATLQAAAPACDDGTVTVDISLRVTNNGPNPGLAYDGSLRVHRTDTGARLALDNVVFDAPVGHVQTLAVSATVPADLLASGQLVAVLDLETWHTNPKSWTADQFTATYTYGTAGCETQILANVVTDCETGQVVSTTYTTIDGQPYTPTGDVGQCVPAAQAVEPCGDTEIVTLCDLGDPSPGSPGESPGEPVTFLRRLTFDCQGQIVSTEDLTLDGEPYVPLGEVGVCGPTGDLEPCRNTSTLLVCDIAEDAETVTPSITDGTIDDTVYATSPNGAAFPLLPKPWTPLWSGSQLVFPQDPDGSGGDGRQVYRTVVGQITGNAPDNCANASGTLTVSARVTNDGPTQGSGGTGWLRLFRDSQQVTNDGVQGSAPVGHVQTLTVTTPITPAELANGEIFLALSLETFHNHGPAQWTADQFTVSVEFDGCATQILANVVTDCETGQVVSTTYTTLDGQPYTPTGQVGECQPVTPDPCQVASTFTVAKCDDLTDESPGEIVCYQEVWAVACQGQVSLIHTYRDDPATEYVPLNPAPCDELGTEGDPIVGVQAHRAQLNPGNSWDALADGGPLLQSVTVTNVSAAPATITTADGASTLFPAETVTWSTVRDFDLTLQGPLQITADAGATVTVAWTTAVTA